MQISEEDRATHSTASNRGQNNLVIAGLVIVLIAITAGYWFVNQDDSAEQTITPVTQQPATTVVTDTNVEQPTDEEPIVIPTKSVVTSTEKPLPNLDESDDWVKQEAKSLSNSDVFIQWITPEQLLRRLVSYWDGLSRGVVLHKTLPLSAPEGAFLVDKQGDIIRMSPLNYQRYDTMISTFVNIDTDSLVAFFHKSRPLLESAIAELGYPKETLDDRIIKAIDAILAAPSFEQPPLLISDSVMYKFANPNLEKLSSVQKQMIRMGPENSEAMKGKLAEIKEALLQQ